MDIDKLVAEWQESKNAWTEHDSTSNALVMKRAGDALVVVVREGQERERKLREAIEYDAALAAYKADLGATEWEAFVGKNTWDALVASSGGDQPPAGELSNIEPDPEYSCGAAYCDDPACTMHAPGHGYNEVGDY